MCRILDRWIVAFLKLVIPNERIKQLIIIMGDINGDTSMSSTLTNQQQHSKMMEKMDQLIQNLIQLGKKTGK